MNTIIVRKNREKTMKKIRVNRMDTHEKERKDESARTYLAYVQRRVRRKKKERKKSTLMSGQNAQFHLSIHFGSHILLSFLFDKFDMR